MIAHITTVHSRHDSRIRHKHIPTLKKEFGEEVILLVQDGKGDEFDKKLNIQIKDTGKKKSRFLRMTLGGLQMVLANIRLKTRIVYFHDPELIPWAIILKIFGKRIIYDVHEDYRKTILDKKEIPRFLKGLLVTCVKIFENLSGKIFDGIIVAGPVLLDYFPKDKTVLLRNLAVKDEVLKHINLTPIIEKNNFCYVGSIANIRGLDKMIEATSIIKDTGQKLCLAGSFAYEDEYRQVTNSNDWENVNYLGHLESRKEVFKLIQKSKAGFLLLQPVERYMDAWPIKLFEYMSAGIPVIASNFPKWKGIIQENNCGIFVDPTNAEDIANAMKWILANPEASREMGLNGQRAVLNKFNWESESIGMINLHKKISNPEK